MLLLATLMVFVLLPADTKADPIALTMDSTHMVAAGGAVTLQSTFANTGVPGSFINAAGYSFSRGFASFTFDPAAFFAAVPAFTASGFTTGAVPIIIFTMLVSPSVAP